MIYAAINNTNAAIHVLDKSAIIMLIDGVYIILLYNLNYIYVRISFTKYNLIQYYTNYYNIKLTIKPRASTLLFYQ